MLMRIPTRPEESKDYGKEPSGTIYLIYSEWESYSLDREIIISAISGENSQQKAS